MGILSRLFGDKNETVNTPTVPNAVRTPAPVSNLNPNNPHDISYALACLVGFSCLRDPDERSSCLLIRIDFQNRETSLYAHGHNWITDHESAAEYTKLGVPAHIADYLTRVDFDINPGTKALSIAFMGAADTELTMRKIQEGLNLLPYKPYTCQLKSYPLGGKPSTVCIDLFIMDD